MKIEIKSVKGTSLTVDDVQTPNDPKYVIETLKEMVLQIKELEKDDKLEK